ncbi:hypothetical protein AB8O64_10900 [Streptomyces sp. QH1-20]|uniref:hypothetical protein n=1 Tax=Streptomyces sp. QH1-20 TaxID=3240934 RepID=UPI0035157BDD
MSKGRRFIAAVTATVLLALGSIALATPAQADDVVAVRVDPQVMARLGVPENRQGGPDLGYLTVPPIMAARELLHATQLPG